MNKLKRFLILFACISICASFLIFPVFADENDFSTDGSIDLLDVGDINIRWKGNDYPYKGIERYSSTEAVEFEFDLPVQNQKVEYIILNLYIENTSTGSVKPTMVNLDNDTSVDFSGSFIGSYGNIYQYKFDLDRAVHFARIQVFWSSPVNAMIGLSSFRGFYDVSEPIYGATIYTSFFYRNLATGLQYKVPSNLGQVTFPYGYGQSVVQDMTDIKWQVTVDIARTRRVLDTYKSITFYMFTSSIPENIGVVLYESGKEAEIIPDTNITFHAYSNSAMPDFTNSGNANNYPDVTYVAIECDLSGYDLSTQTISLSFDLFPSEKWNSTESVDDNFWFSMNRAFLTMEVEEQKWYQKFWSWMSGGLSSLGDRIVSAIGGITFPESTEDPSSPLKEPAIGFETAASDFNEAMDVIDSVTKPSISLERDEAIPTLDPIVVNTMGILTGDPTIIMMLGVVVTLCIISILLFGRRD